MEILKFLSDSHDYKPLNEFIKSIYPYKNYEPLMFTLKEMYNSQITIEQGENIIYLNGDYNVLGKEFYIKKLVDGEEEFEFKEVYYPSFMKQKPAELYFGTLDNAIFSGRISPLGRKELAEYELQKSIKSVNDSVTKTNRMTLLIAGLAAFFSLMALLVPIIKSDSTQVPELKETNSILQQQVQKLDSLLQKQNAYPVLNQSRKDSVNK